MHHGNAVPLGLVSDALRENALERGAAFAKDPALLNQTGTTVQGLLRAVHSHSPPSRPAFSPLRPVKRRIIDREPPEIKPPRALFSYSSNPLILRDQEMRASEIDFLFGIRSRKPRRIG